MKPEALARRAGSAAGADGGGIPSPAPDARKESDGDGKKVATGSNVAAWDEDEEALGALIYKTSRAAKARDESIIGKKSRAPKEEEAPARSKREDKRKESGETSVTPRASSFSATHDVDEEALGALIYKNSRTAKARAQANNGNKRRREKPLSSDEGKPPRKKRRRKAKEEGESSRKKVAVSGSSTRPRRGAAIKAAAKLSRSGSDCEQRETSVTRARPRRHVVAIGAATKISGHMSQEDGGSDDDESLGYDSDSSGVTSKRPYRSGHRRNGNKGTPLKQEERNDQDWNEKYEQLKAYRADHGHCNVPQRYGNDPQLGRWVKRQRQEKRKGKLPCKRAELLQKIGFQWTTVNVGVFKSNDKQWMKNFEKLQAYKAENGDCNVPKRYALLGKWVQWQRYLYKDGKLADERKERLEEIGFNWVGDKKGGSEPNNEQWNERFEQVRAYKAEQGDCKVRQKYEVDGSKLGVWVMTQRQEYKNGKLTDERKERLEEIGFEWTVGRGKSRTAKGKTGGTKSKVAAKEGTASSCGDESKPNGQEKRNRKTRERSSQSIAVGDVGYNFRKRFDGVWYEGKVVKIWRGEHRRCVYTDGDAEDLSLSQLRALAKEEREASDSTKERSKETDADPDRPKSIEDVWNGKCRRLKDFYDTHGHWNIHPSYRVDGFLLASWANIQIQACKRGQLSKARQQKLKAIGFRLAGNGVSGRKGLKKRKADKMAEESADNSDAGSSCGKEDDDSSCSLKTPPEEIEPPGVGDAVLAYYLYSCGKKGEWIDATITNVNTHSENGAEWATYDVEYNDGYTDDHLPDSKIRRCPPPEDNGKEEDNDGEEEAAEEKRATRSRTNDVELQRVDASTNRREERAAARKKRTARSAPADGDSSRANEEGSRPVLHDDARTRKQIKEDALWSEKFEQLLAYKTKHGHCNMAASCDGDNHLGEWVEEQREQYELWKEGEHSELTDERVAMLESVDFDFAPGRSRNKKRQKVVDKTQTAGPKEPRKARTIASAPRERPGRSAAKKAAAKLFRKESNEISNANYDIDSSDLPRKRRSNSNQRRSSNKGNKPKGRRRKDYDEKWDNRFGQLQAFVKEHGHCNVMKRDDNDPQLGRWVSKQRARLKEGKLAAERKELLDEIGFSWSILREWDEMFELLRTYKKKHGHCNVPHKYPENPQLANWTRKQQWRRKEGKLADDRIKLLDSIEFDWGDERNRGERWDDHFDLLRAYKKKHGHCNVRRHDRVKGIALGHWVGYQRMALKEGYLSLSSERKKRLDELGFQWRIR